MTSSSSQCLATATFQSLDLDSTLLQNLNSNQFENMFEIQELIIPVLLQNNSRSCIQPRHILASAPTGSGKTLSYVVPIIHSLVIDPSLSTRLKALVILPTRELAQQVYEVFCKLAKGLNLKIGLVTGQNPFEQEQLMLVGQHAHKCIAASSTAKNCGQYLYSNQDILQMPSDNNGDSLLHILVCTPGRLQDHLQFTEGFTLQHLQFLVMDEADRLMSNAYHSWVKILIQSTNPSTSIHQTFSTTHQKYHSNIAQDSRIHQSTCLSQLFMMRNIHQHRVQRLLFSATLTDNPGKLALLGIKNPLVYQVGASGSVHDDTKANASDVPSNSCNDFRAENIEKIESNQKPINMLTTITKASVEKSTLSNLEILKKQNEMNDTKFFLPPLLTESICISDTQNRPLVLASIIFQVCLAPESEAILTKSLKSFRITHLCSKPTDMILVFTSSVITTHKLCTLLQLINNQIVDSQKKSSPLSSSPTVAIDASENYTSTQDARTLKRRKLTRNKTISENNNNELQLEDSHQVVVNEFLFNGAVVAISRTIRSEKRDEIITKCKQGKVKVLIATDQMARGIDLPSIKLVINYDCPNDVKSYLHRVGRTARGQGEGHALTILKVGQSKSFQKLHSVVVPSLRQQQLLRQLDLKQATEIINTPKNNSSILSNLFKIKPNVNVQNSIQTVYTRALKLLPLVVEDNEGRFNVLSQ